ncbi:MAG: VOC family protein [Pseudomonadota bacterium]
MSNQTRINYVELPAADLKAIEAFYATAFGWRFTWYGEDYLAFNDGKIDGGFFRSDTRARQDAGSVLLVLLSDDLEVAYEQVTALGAVIIKEIFLFPGGRRFHFADPNGNEVAIWTMESESEKP